MSSRRNEGESYHVVKMTFPQVAAVAVAIIMLIILATSCFEMLNKKSSVESGNISQNSQIVRDYLDGKEIKAKDAWWIRLSFEDNRGYLRSVSKELKLDLKDVLEKTDNYSVVYRPEK